MHFRNEVSQQSECDALGKVLLETSGLGIHVDVSLTRTTYLNIAADQVHLFISTVQYSLMAVASFSRMIHPTLLQILLLV